MAEVRRESPAPWITAAVAGVVLIGLLLVYFIALRPDQNDVVGDLTASEKAALNAAGTEAVNLVSYRRAEFDADFKRALDGSTGALRSDVQAKKASTLAAMTNGKFDLSGRLTHKALQGPADSGKSDSYVVLVTLNGYQSTAKDAPVPQNLAITMVKVKGDWLASDVKSIGIT